MLEMKDRRRKLAKSLAKTNEGLLTEFDKEYDQIINNKISIMQQLTSTKLEANLLESSKSVALELVNIFMNTGGSKGLLILLERKRFKHLSSLMKNK